MRAVWIAVALGMVTSWTTARAEPIRVVASFSLLADFVVQVGGDRVAVSALVGPDQDAHIYQPRPSDASALAKAQLVVINGLGFEGWITRLLQAAAYRGPVTVASDGIQTLAQSDRDGYGDHDHGHGHANTHGHGAAPDPHAWQDPRNAMVYVRNIAQALARIDPAHAEEYAQSAQAYAAQLETLDGWIAEQVATVPAERRVAITSHASLRYYGARYGVSFLAVQGLTTASEPSARAVASLIQQARGEQVAALFLEGIANPALLRQIANESGAAIGGMLYSDALTSPRGPAPHYLDMMRVNTNTLIQAMRGDPAGAPDKPTP